MPLPSPNLDDRSFFDLVEEARRTIAKVCPEWTDLSAGDPGMVLLEVFAHITETMIYRLNRLPEKAYIEFLRLIGVRLQPPAAASVTLTFTLARPADRPIEIPRGTRVTVSRTEGGAPPPVFVTARAAVIAQGSVDVKVLAHDCELVEGELAGRGTGMPGLSVVASRPPIVAPTGEDLDLVVAVEAAPGELDGRAPALEHQGKAYRVWREVENFSNLGDDRFVYVADRITGTITFAPMARMRSEGGQLSDAPEALAAVPPAQREIRLWYRRGGGPGGNVAANALTVLKDPIPGLQVVNAQPATGGRAAETLDNALIRGPQELHSLQRAVTARDFELLALRSSGAVARAKAFTQSALWTHAPAGTVEVLLVPDLPDDERPGGRVTAATLRARETEEARLRIVQALDERRPLGTVCLVNWARYKTVRVQARVVVHREEDPAALRERVLGRLHQTINPLPGKFQASGWRFGHALRVSHVYDVALSEPGVSYVDRVRLVAEEVPEKDVRCIASDMFQPHTWFAGAGDALFRSVDDADGWEIVGRFPNAMVEAVVTHPGRSGLVALSTRIAGDKGGARLHVSRDCGETWEQKAETAFNVVDLAWMTREGVPVLLLATDVGLYELAMRQDSSPVQVVLLASGQEPRGFYAVTVSSDLRGETTVAVAAQSMGGVFASTDGGRARTFRYIGLKDEDVRVLAVQQEGPRAYLWAGMAAPSAGEPGTGCSSWELLASGDPPEGWLRFGRNWTGGSCRGLAFQGSRILAASHHRGVLRLPARRGDAGWEAPALECGLPLRAAENLFQPVDAVAVDARGALVLAGGQLGIFRSKNGSADYESVSNTVFLDKVTLPPTWLFCSGEHDIQVVSEDEAERD